MDTEYEAVFTGVKVEDVQNKLRQLGAKLLKSRYLQRRTTLQLPISHRSDNKWLRVRDEGDRITLALKAIEGEGIAGQKELQVNVSSYKDTVLLLEAIGAEKKSEQESYRELWLLNKVEVVIDEWPFLQPYIEIEAKSDKEVRLVAEKLGFSWTDARFCNVTKLYSEKYNTPENFLDHVKELTFAGHNPFIAN